jgi:hypothetical protein
MRTDVELVDALALTVEAEFVEPVAESSEAN